MENNENFCSNCGAVLDSSQNFCSKCGKSLVPFTQEDKPAEKPGNVFSVLGLVFSAISYVPILGFITFIPALIFTIIGLCKCKNRRKSVTIANVIVIAIPIIIVVIALILNVSMDINSFSNYLR